MLTVHLRIADDAAHPTPVRLRVCDAAGTYFAPLGRTATFPVGIHEDVGGHLRLGAENFAYIDGQCEIPLPAGVPLRIRATKGPAFLPLDETVVLKPGQISLRFAMKRVPENPLAGWLQVDARAHFLSPHAAMLEAAAEDLDVVNLLAKPKPFLANDGETYFPAPNLLAFSGQVPALERDGRHVVVNTFNAHPMLGRVSLLNAHRPIFPLSFGAPDATDDWSICDWCDQCHRKTGLVIWADAFRPDGGLPGGEALVAAILGKLDAIEYDAQPRSQPFLPWYYRLLNCGLKLPLVGASAKESNRTPLGAMRTYVPPDGNWVEAVRGGRTVVSNGPLLAMTVADTVSVVCPTPCEKLELIANGQVIASSRSGALNLPTPTEPGWIAARAADSASGAFAHTSPMWIGEPPRRRAALPPLRQSLEQTRDWIAQHAVFREAKRKAHLLALCEEAAGRLVATDG